MDFSVILNTPIMRALVQQNMLETEFAQAATPLTLFRKALTPIEFAGQIGDTKIFTAPGLIAPDLAPVTPGTDAAVADYTAEQWEATLQQFGKSHDTHMPSSVQALASLLLQDMQMLGIHAGQTLNRLARNALYNAAMSGWTVCDGGQTTSTLLVKRLNGFTKARRPDLALGSAVRFAAVSSNNPLTVIINTTTGEVTRTVTGYTPTNAGDEMGPGTLTLTGGAVTVADRAYVMASDRTSIVRVGGGNRVDDVGTTDILTFPDLRTALARLQNQNIQRLADGYYHCHIDPVAQAQIFADHQFSRLITGVPDWYAWKDYTLGTMLGTVFFANSECPQVHTVNGGLTATYPVNAQGIATDPFGGEVWNNGVVATGVKIHRTLLVGVDAAFEHWSDQAQMVSEAGLNGKMADAKVSGQGIDINVDRIKLITRAPIDRFQQMVSNTWSFIGAHVCRTDVATGDAARYKRTICIESGEA
jgi:hypothetical protein